MTTRGFDANFLEELKSKNDIVAVISKYVPLTRKGANYWACCPFHGEKTPSFAVRDDRQFYKWYQKVTPQYSHHGYHQTGSAPFGTADSALVW